MADVNSANGEQDRRTGIEHQESVIGPSSPTSITVEEEDFIYLSFPHLDADFLDDSDVDNLDSSLGHSQGILLIQYFFL